MQIIVQNTVKIANFTCRKPTQSFKNASKIDKTNEHQLYEQSRTICLPCCLFAAAKPVAGSAWPHLTDCQNTRKKAGSTGQDLGLKCLKWASS
jgi:hypothetical protein